MEQIIIPAIIIYLVIINLLAFALMGIDKKRAMKGAWRIPEKSLFLAVILGGALGGVLGMKHFHHKTQHWYFKLGFPFFLILWIGILGAGIYFLIFR